MVGGGTVLGSTIRTFYRLRFSIAHAIQDPYRGRYSQGSLSGSLFRLSSSLSFVDIHRSIRSLDRSLS